MLLFAVMMFLYNWVGGILVLLGLRVIQGMTWAISTTSTMTAVTDMIPIKRRGEGIAWYSMSMTFAMAVGPIWGIWVVQEESFRALFLCAAALSAIAWLLTIKISMPFRPQSSVKRIDLFEKPVLPVAASVFFLFVAYGGITTFVPLFSDSIKVNSGVFFLTYAATLALIRPIAGKITDRYGETFIILPSLVITVAALIMLSLSTGSLGILLSAMLFSIGFGSAQPALQVAAIRLARIDRIGAANATLSTASDLGIGLGAIILGQVSQFMSYRTLFTVSAVSVVLSFLIFTFVIRRLLLKATSANYS